MQNSLRKIIVTALLFALVTPSFGADAARRLKRLVGYTIVLADTVDRVTPKDGFSKIIKLSGGLAFKVDGLLLEPLPLSDVIIFAKPLPEELQKQYKGKVPDSMLYSYKLLVDNEVYDATAE